MRRLIMFIVIFAVFLAFIALNLGEDHTCNVSLGFRTFEHVPVFLSALFSFALGMMFTLPLILSFGKKKKKAAAPVPNPEGGKKKHWGFFRGASSKPVQTTELTDEDKKENSPYGID